MYFSGMLYINKPESGPLPFIITKAKSGQLFAHESRVRVPPVPLLLILLCGKCDAEMINCPADPVCLVLGII